MSGKKYHSKYCNFKERLAQEEAIHKASNSTGQNDWQRSFVDIGRARCGKFTLLEVSLARFNCVHANNHVVCGSYGPNIFFA